MVHVMLNAPPGIYALLFGLFILSAVFLRLRVIASRTELSGLLAGTGVVMIDETPPHDAAHTGSPHPAITHFIRRFNELINQWSVLPAGNGRRPRNLTAKKVHDLLVEQAPSVAPSQSQLYRIYRGDTAPSIVDVLELARLFGVSPQSFLPETAPTSEVHSRLQRPRHHRG